MIKVNQVATAVTLKTYVAVSSLGATKKPVSLTTSMSPSTDKISIDLDANTVTPTGMATMTITVYPTAAAGTYTITVTGSAAGDSGNLITRSTSYTLDVIG
jgi:hypothetical protein